MGITVNTSGLLSSSGFDVQGLVDDIIQEDQQQEQPWKDEQTALTAQTSAINQLNSDLASVNSSVQSLTDVVGAFTQRVGVSTDNAIVGATVSNSAAVGDHTVEVNSLATKAVYNTTNTGIASGDTTLSGGSFTITVNGNSQTIDISGSTDTLNSIAAAINANTGLGVTATVVQNSTGAELALVSNSTGAASDITLTPSSDSALSFNKASSGADASATIDGIPVTSATNTISNVVPGVTFQLNGQLQGSPVTVSVEANTDGVSQAVSSFVTAYNQLTTDINAQFAYDSTSDTSGPLAGDATLRTVQAELLQAVSGASVGSSGTPTLGSLGITMNDDGTLSLDTSTLNNALANQFSDVQSFFQDPASGFATGLSTVVTSLTDPVNGAFTVELQGISNTQTDLTNDINNFEDNLTTIRQQLVTQLTNANDLLQQLPSQLDEINAELGSLPGSSSSSSSSSKS
jgi:flagellar hook-associated protein 2